MRNLLETYQDFEASQKCYLDSKYVQRVLPGIMTMVVVIDVDKLKGRVMFNGDLDQRLTHLRIELEAKGVETSKHCNLLLLEDRYVYRYEPLSEFHLPAGLNDLINITLQDYLSPTELREFDLHPQQTCQNKGLCVAYVIKAAVHLTLHPEDELELESEEDIKHFASAVEALY